MKKFLNIFLIFGIALVINLLLSVREIQAVSPSQDQNCIAQSSLFAPGTLSAENKARARCSDPNFVSQPAELKIEGSLFYCCLTPNNPYYKAPTPILTPISVPVPTGAPTIISVNPKKGPVGTSVEITGTNFESACDKNRIMFKQIESSETKSFKPDSCLLSDQILKSTIPSFAGSGKSIEITVLTDLGKSSPWLFQIGSTGPSLPGTGGGAPISSKERKKEPKLCEKNNLTITNPNFYQAGAQAIAYDGLVPCGKCSVITSWPPSEQDKKSVTGQANKNVKYVDCQFCHFQVMFAGIINFILWMVIIPLGILFIVIGGLMYLFSAGDPGKIAKAKSMIMAVAVGLAIIFGAWLIINVFFSVIGLSEFSIGLTGPGKWFKIPCEVKIEGQTSPSQSPSTPPAVTPPTTPPPTPTPSLPPKEEPIHSLPPLPPTPPAFPE